MAILIHKIKKKIITDSGTSIVFQMTPEMLKNKNRGPVSIKMKSIDVNRTRYILIADRDKKTRYDFQTYLHALDYSNFKLIDNPENLLTTIQKSSNVFCFCDYRILDMPDWNFFSKKMAHFSFPVIALTPSDYHKNIQSIYQNRIAGSLRKPIQLSDLKKILFKFMGPPLKKIAQ